MALSTRFASGVIEKIDHCPARLGVARIRRNAGDERRDHLDLRRQRADDVDAVNGHQLGHLLNADVGLAAQHDEAGEPRGAAGAVFRLGLHRRGDAELLENLGEMNAALAAADRF